MMQTKPLTVLDFVAEFLIFFVHDEESVKITFIGVGVAFADIAGTILFGGPDTDRILPLSMFPEFVLQGSFARFEILKLLLHLAVHLHIMGFQDPGIAEGIAVVKHFPEMFPAESGLVGLLTDVTFHIGRT